MASFLGLLADGKDGAEAVAGGHGLLQEAVVRWQWQRGPDGGGPGKDVR